MSYKKVLSYDGKDFVVRLTRKSNIEIEEMQKSLTKKLLNDKDNQAFLEKSNEIIKVQQLYEKIEKIKDEEKKEKELAKAQAEYTDLMILMSKADVDKKIDNFEVVYVLIKNVPTNPELSKDEYEKMLEYLESEHGLEELYVMFDEIVDNVFMEMEAIKKALEARKKSPVAPAEVVNGKA